MRFLICLFSCFSLCAQEQILSLGEYGSVRYVYENDKVVEIDRLNRENEVVYSHSYQYEKDGRLVSDQLIEEVLKLLEMELDLDFWKAREVEDLNIAIICYHNDREGISYDDIIEHVGNGEYGSAWRDAKEKEEIQGVLSDVKETALSVLETIGNEVLRGQDD